MLLAILAIMLCIAWRVRKGVLTRRPRFARGLTVAGSHCFATMLLAPEFRIDCGGRSRPRMRRPAGSESSRGHRLDVRCAMSCGDQPLVSFPF
jgi:hypothetical protein